jgi:hypothetical protein
VPQLVRLPAVRDRHGLPYPSAVTALTGSDYRGALDVLRIAHESDEGGPFSGDTLAALRRLIPSAIATSQEWDPTHGYRVVVDGADRADVGPVWAQSTCMRRSADHSASTML